MFLSKIIYFIAVTLRSTYRFRFIGLENLTLACQKSQNQNFLLGVWHQNLLHGILAQTKKNYVVIVSKSKDVDPVAYACRRMGNKVVRGSSKNKAGVDKGGKLAKEEMIKVLKEGYPGAVTIDGPKGPAKQVKPGIIDMAIKSGTCLVPYLPIAETYWSFNSWDQFRLPKPFSRIIISYGTPIPVAALSEGGAGQFESYAEKLQQELSCSNENNIIQQFKDWKSLSKHNNW